MKKLTFLLCVLAACMKPVMTQGEAEMGAAKLFGLRSFCVGDKHGWTCMAVESSSDHGQLVYRPSPVVVCADGTCTKVSAEGEYQCKTMGVAK